MSLSPSAFEAIVPYRYITFTLPLSLQDKLLQFAVLDYPLEATDSPGNTHTAAMFVPPGRESDWIFSTFAGHLQLLLSAHPAHSLSRLILVSQAVSHGSPVSFESTVHYAPSTTLQKNLAPLLIALTPKAANRFPSSVPEVPLLVYEDDVVRSSVVEICEGPHVGEMLVENVELETDGLKEFRRRLRFKRMPNLVQTQMRIHPKQSSSLSNLEKVEFELDMEVLVQPYLIPMTTGILMISPFLEKRIIDGIRPKVLCLGVGGGAVLGFLAAKLNFEVVGVEQDEVVLQVAKRYFGLESSELIHLVSGDGIQHVKKLAKSTESEFEVIMVDLDCSDPTLGPCAPPVEFIRKSLLVAVRDLLFQKGVLIINTVLFRKRFYDKLIGLMQEIFLEVYEVDVGNEENTILIATRSELESSWDSEEGSISDALKSIVPRSCIESLRRIPKK